MNSYNVIGVMSGTSLDGLDICYCSFNFSKEKIWNFKINNAETVEIPNSLKQKLTNAINYSALDIALLNNELGNYIGDSVNTFINKNNLNKSLINFIASHGHTIFHQPEKKLTLQIGNGANISAYTKLPVINDFRTIDVAMSGHGAPLVPIGDEFLFSEYDYCLNLGGITNISFKKDKRLAFDICPNNIVLNFLANKLNLEYDNNGRIAKSGNLNESLLNELNLLNYYNEPYPKSLGIEWIQSCIFPILSKFKIPIADQLRTFCEHIAIQISKHLSPNSQVLITGGGAYNKFLIERIKELNSCQIIIPDKQLIDFKEALIFGFLG
ncbi:MAG: anhydro-N-acetylmuramic acid kinase, partial [Flavobacteriales bacterium]|nr:anhydro-N-acetylmuramic acid kinase [Flavobacteriales bacterium]